MNATNTEMATAVEPSIVRASRSLPIVIPVAGLVALNLLIYLIGRAAGGAFTYTQAGQPTKVDAGAVILMSAAPLAIGLALTARLSRRWPAVITAARVVAPVLAIATIVVMTIPAGFDTTSTMCLAAMHLALAAAAALSLGALARRRERIQSP